MSNSQLYRFLLSCSMMCTLFLSNCTPPTNDTKSILPGYWGGQAEHNGQVMDIAISFEMTDSIVSGEFIVPQYEWAIPISKFKVDENKIYLGSGDSLIVSDENTINGYLPSVLVPNYQIPFTLNKQKKSKSLPNENKGQEATPVQKVELASGAIWGSMSADSKHLYVGTIQGNFSCIDPVSKQKDWEYESGGAIHSPALITKEAIYLYSDAGATVKLSKQGKINWKYTFEDTISNSEVAQNRKVNYDYYASGPAYSDGIVYQGTNQGSMVAIDDASSKLLWKFKSDGSIRSTPVVIDGICYFGSMDGNVYALRADDGSVIWKFDTKQPVVSTPLVANNKVIIGSRSYDLWALDSKKGTVDWKYYMWFSWIESSAVVEDDVLYIGSSDAQTVYAINVQDGSEKWLYRIKGSAWSSPLIHNGIVYTGSLGHNTYFANHKARVAAVDKDSGKELWYYEMQSGDTDYYGFGTTPVVLNDQIWFAGTDGNLYGFSDTEIVD